MSIESLLDKEQSNKTQKNHVDAHYDNARLKNLTESHSIEEEEEREAADDDLEKSLRTLSGGGEITETHENSTVSAEFLDSLSAEDIKSMFNNGEIKESLVEEDENGKKYITIKGERFYIGKYDHGLYNHKNDNGIIYEGTYVLLGNDDCQCEFQTDNDKIIIYYNHTEKIKFSDGGILTQTGNIWHGNGINIRSRYNLGYFYLSSINGQELKLSSYVGSGSYIGFDKTLRNITQILSKIKDNKEQCQIVDECTLKVGDTTYKTNQQDNINDIAEWINNYYKPAN